jgi:hypothetical protein
LILEPPFVVAQLIVLAIFAVLCLSAAIKFRPAVSAATQGAWQNWTGYESSPEALRAGIMRLTALTGGGRGHHQKHA